MTTTNLTVRDYQELQKKLLHAENVIASLSYQNSQLREAFDNEQAKNKKEKPLWVEHVEEVNRNNV